jgi:RNA polymerase sigma-70 factor (ECF subfamily)
VWFSRGQPGTTHDDTDDTDDTDDASVVTAGQFDRSAFESIYRGYLPRVYHYVKGQVSNEEDAADLTQQIFLQALDALPSYQAKGLPFAAWLFRIARNVVIDSYRKRQRTNYLLALDALPETVFASADQDPLTMVVEGERVERLRQALNALDRQKRELLLLRFAGELSSTEIAAVVGKSPAAVQKQLTRMLQDLKGHVHDHR